MDGVSAIAAIAKLLELIQGLTSGLTAAKQISDILVKVQAEGRTMLSQEEWDVIDAADKTERQALVDVITRKLLAE